MASCSVHPSSDAPYICGMCRAAMCDDCAVYSRDGLIICRACQRNPHPSGPLPPAETGEIALREPIVVPPARVAPARRAVYCATHTTVEATFRCAQCHSPVCATCDFSFPGGIHLCPPCATDPKQKITSGRKAKIFWSIGIGAACIVGSVAVILLARTPGVDRDVRMLLGCFVFLFPIISLVGLILGITSFSRKTFNPGYIWLGVVLNGLVILLWSLLMLVGLALRH